MNCYEVRPLQDAYLDSELDARTSIEVQEHLKACAECAHLFAEEQKQEARIKAGLQQGEKTRALWDQIEQSVAAVAVADARARIQQGRSTQERPLTPALSPSEGDRIPRRDSRFAPLNYLLSGLRHPLPLEGGEGKGAGAASIASRFYERLQAGWLRSRWAWSGLAAAWVVILVLDCTAREPDTNAAARQAAPSVSELRLAWKQKQRIMAELNFTTESASAEVAKPAAPSPRSDRRKETLNT
jgi:anti-sigma factor RsiW